MIRNKGIYYRYYCLMLKKECFCTSSRSYDNKQIAPLQLNYYLCTKYSWPCRIVGVYFFYIRLYVLTLLLSYIHTPYTNAQCSTSDIYVIFHT